MIAPMLSLSLHRSESMFPGTAELHWQLWFFSSRALCEAANIRTNAIEIACSADVKLHAWQMLIAHSWNKFAPEPWLNWYLSPPKLTHFNRSWYTAVDSKHNRKAVLRFHVDGRLLGFFEDDNIEQIIHSWLLMLRPESLQVVLEAVYFRNVILM